MGKVFRLATLVIATLSIIRLLMAGFWKVIGPLGATNLITNPSFETNSTGWTAAGTNTVTRVATQSFLGDWSLLCTYQDDNILAIYTTTLPTANTTYKFHCRLYVPSNWDGGNIDLQANLTDFAGAADTTVHAYTDGVDSKGVWLYLETTLTIAADAGPGSLYLVASSAPTAGRTVHIDAVNLTEGAFASTPIDGDQPDCEWNGAAHGSTSTRNAQSRKGGRIYDMATDFGLYVETMDGVGMPPVSNISYGRAFRDGEFFQRQRVRMRPFRLRTLVNESSMSGYHEARQDFIEVIKPIPNGQPILFRYSGADVEKEIAAQYDTGLELSGPKGFAEQVGLQFLAHDPFFYGLGEESTSLNTSDGAVFTIVAGRVNGRWDNLGPPISTGATYTSTRAIAAGTDKTVYIGGDFLNFNGNADADYIAAWDGAAWDDIGAMSGIVHTLKTGPDGLLYAGGAFTTAGGVLVRNVATWDGSTWAALGPPSSGGTVEALAHGRDNKLYVGGSFTNWDGIASADRLASWDGANWAAVSTGANGTILTMAAHPNGDLYIGGDFTIVGGPVSATNIAKWDGSVFTALGAGCNNDVKAIAINEQGDVYVGGLFTTADGVTVNGIARWTGVTFEPLGTGMESATQVDYLGFWRGDLIAAGPFTVVNGVDYAQRIALWNGSRWYKLDVDFPSAVTQGPVVAIGDDLYTGLFTTGAASYAGVATVTPGGDEKVYPIIILKRDNSTGTAALLTIRNETTGKQLLFDYDMLAGETLTIDLRLDNQRMVSSFWGEQWRILPGSDTAEFYLLPGDNEITCYVSKTGTAAVSGFIRWRNTYWGVD